MYTMTLDCIFAFRLSKVKKAGELGMAQYQFLILDHGLYHFWTVLSQDLHFHLHLSSLISFDVCDLEY